MFLGVSVLSSEVIVMVGMDEKFSNLHSDKTIC